MAVRLTRGPAYGRGPRARCAPVADADQPLREPRRADTDAAARGLLHHPVPRNASVSLCADGVQRAAQPIAEPPGCGGHPQHDRISDSAYARRRVFAQAQERDHTVMYANPKNAATASATPVGCT